MEIALSEAVRKLSLQVSVYWNILFFYSGSLREFGK